MTGTWSTIGGGLALFLVGIWLATDALKIAGGGYLRENMRRWTRDRGRAFLTGLSIAVLVPSSGALTFACIGLVNCGLVGLSNALWVLVGCGFGSVITSWLIVAVASSADHYQLGLLYVAIGVALRWTGPGTMRGAWGQALVGLGVLLLSVQVLSGAFAGLPESFHFSALWASPLIEAVLFFGAGLVLAAVLKSSSAAMVLALLAVGSGRAEFSTAALFLLGANLGASAAAAQTLLWGTPSSRRMAAGHVALHLTTTAVGVLLLIPLSPLLVGLPGLMGDPLVTLAIFHTLFVACGSLVFWPLGHPLSRILSDHLSGEPDDQRPSNLDPNVLSIPDLALEGLLRELREIGDLSRRLARTVLSGQKLTDFRRRQDLALVEGHADAVDDYVVRLSRVEVPRSVADPLLEVPRASQSLRRLTEQLAVHGHRQLESNSLLDSAVRSRLTQLELSVLHLIEGCDPFGEDFSVAACTGELDSIESHLRQFKTRILGTVANYRIPPEELEAMLERMARVRHIARLAVEGALGLAAARVHGGLASFEAPRFDSPEEEWEAVTV